MPLFLYSSDPRTAPRMPRDYAAKDYRSTRVVPRPSPRLVVLGRLVFWTLIALAVFEALRVAL